MSDYKPIKGPKNVLTNGTNPENASQLDMPLSQAVRDRLTALRKSLLTLHKVLLDGEKIQYEKTNGQIPSVNMYLQLVMNDSHFAWLHQISKLIVEIDEMLDANEAGSRAGSDMIERAQILFSTREGQEDSDFMGHYKKCLVNNPGAVMAHSELRRSLLSDA